MTVSSPATDEILDRRGNVRNGWLFGMRMFIRLACDILSRSERRTALSFAIDGREARRGKVVSAHRQDVHRKPGEVLSCCSALRVVGKLDQVMMTRAERIGIASLS